MRKIIILALLLVSCQAQPEQRILATPTASLYVSPTGNDSGQCTQSAPCKTITRAIAVSPIGGTVTVLAGTYRENVRVTKSITLQGQGAIIDGTGLPVQDGGGLINIPASVSGATVTGFEVMNGVYYGISVFGNSNTISGNKIHHIKKVGYWVRDAKYNVFENNELYFSVLENSVSFNGSYYVCNPNNTTGWASAVNPWGSANNNTFRNNYIHDNCGEGLVLYSNDLAEGNRVSNNWSVEIYIDAHTDVIVRDNIVSNTRPYVARGSNNAWKAISYGIAIADENVCLADRNTITGNTVTGTRYGFSFYSYSPCSGLKNTVIENNTFINTWEYGIRITTGAHVNSFVRNNVISSPNGLPYTIAPGVTFLGVGQVVTQTATFTPTRTQTSTPIPPTATRIPATNIPTNTPVFDPRCDVKYLPSVCVYIP